VEGAGISPRARHAADAAGLDLAAIAGSGPGGRVVERDVREELAGREPLTRVARDRIMARREGTGIGGHVRESDLATARPAVPAPDYSALGPSKDVPVKGIRKAIAARLLHSVRTTAQVTLHATADASALRAARARLKTDAQTYGVTINDLVMHTVVRVLAKFPSLNAYFLGDRIAEFEQVHLGVAVQTPRGLLAPVIRRAEALSLIELSAEGKRLAQACLDGAAKPQELTGATFTVTNLGPQGVEFFTPILNPPEVAILGVGGIVVRPVEGPGGLRFVPHLGLSLTFDHQALDGHGAAVFLEALGEAIARIDVGASGA
jgi:pyruvate dehydrogenase E2 component (dihydrolipoamide acetyltransferase)